MTNEGMIQIGNRIKNLRKERNLSQEEVAKQLEVSRQAVTRWENGKALPSSGHMLKLEELKADIKAEIKRCVWAVWALLLTVLFFVICWFFNEYLGWRVYVWHYIDLYCYAWTACFLVLVGGALQKKRFVASICGGCVVLLFALVSFGGFKTNYTYNRGSEDGYWAGYKVGVQNAKTGEDTQAEQEDKDCSEYWDKCKASTTMWGVSRWKGFMMHWSTGYNAGYKEGQKNEQ